MNKLVIKKFLKFLLIFICYFIYSTLLNVCLNFVNVEGVISNFVADFIFVTVSVYMFRDNLLEDLKNAKLNYNIKSFTREILKYLGIMFLSLIVYTIFSSFVFAINHMDINDITVNTLSINKLISSSIIYFLFKTLVFGVVAEEIVFREGIGDIVTNNILFVVISSLIYASMNIIFNNLDNSLLWLDFIQYFIFYSVLSIAYAKNKKNIFIPITIKFIYNLIPIIVSIVTMVIK